MTSASPFSIAVIGAGLGGLVLVRVLQLHGVPVTVFEREPTSSSRAQGGSLDMHPESGQYALETAQLTTQFRKVARPEGDETKIVDKHGTVVFQDLPSPAPESLSSQDEPADSPLSGRPEVDRGQLRQLLLDSLLPGTVHWEHNLEFAQFDDDDDDLKVSLTFSRPSPSPSATFKFDVVIGADGAWSRVRKLLSPAQPTYTGVTFVDVQLVLGDSNNNNGSGHDNGHNVAELDTLVGNGSLFALGDSRAIIAQRNSGGVVRVYAALRVPLGVLDAAASQGNIRTVVLQHFDGWAEKLRALIDAPNATGFDVRPLWVLPSGHRWDTAPGARVTLLGDAAHLMVPFAGAGANLAMADGADLGLALAKAKTPAEFTEYVRQYEIAMQERARDEWEKSMQNMDMFLSDSAPASAVEKMKELMASGGPPDMLYEVEEEEEEETLSLFCTAHSLRHGR